MALLAHQTRARIHHGHRLFQQVMGAVFVVVVELGGDREASSRKQLVVTRTQRPLGIPFHPFNVESAAFSMLDVARIGRETVGEDERLDLDPALAGNLLEHVPNLMWPVGGDEH